MPRMGASEYSVFSAARHAWVKRRPIVQRVMRSERLFLASSRSLDTFSVVHQGNVEFLEVSWRKLGILPPSASRFPLISGHDQFAPVYSPHSSTLLLNISKRSNHQAISSPGRQERELLSLFLPSPCAPMASSTFGILSTAMQNLHSTVCTPAHIPSCHNDVQLNVLHLHWDE